MAFRRSVKAIFSACAAFAVKDAMAITPSSYQHLVLYGKDWEDVPNVQVKVESIAAGFKPNENDWVETGFTASGEKKRDFAYLIAVQVGDTVSVKIGKDVAVRKIDECSKGPCAETFTADGANANLQNMVGFQADVRNHEVWKEVIRHLRSESISDVDALKEKLQSVFKQVRQEQKGYEINIFMDGMQSFKGQKLTMVFKLDNGEEKRTAQKIQDGVGSAGAVFSAWTVQKAGGELHFEINGKNFGHMKIRNVDSLTSPFTIEDDTINAVILVNNLHARMTKIWEKVVHYHDAKDDHPYWDFGALAWKQEALVDLFKKIKEDQTLRPQTFESDGEAAKPSRWKIILVVIVLVALLGFAVFWFFCKDDGDDSDSDIDSTSAGKSAPNESYSVKANVKQDSKLKTNQNNSVKGNVTRDSKLETNQNNEVPSQASEMAERGEITNKVSNRQSQKL